MKLSVAIPTSDMKSKKYFFERCLESLWSQTFQDFEVVVTDNSSDDAIKEICDFYNTGIVYYRNPVKGMAYNTNEAIKRSKGSLIKILYMDDYLAHEQALEDIVDRFRGKWLVTSYCHTINGSILFDTRKPVYTQDIHLGNNKIGSPSVLTIKNDKPLLFDENMTWLLDCDYYKRMYEAYGAPVIVDDVGVVIGLHEGQATHTMGDEVKLKEHQYIRQKYANEL